MTNLETAARDFSAEIKRQWVWFLVLGVAMAALGFMAFRYLTVATLASVLYIGALMIVAGVAQFVHAFMVKGWGGFLGWLLAGVLYTLAGVATFYNPALAAATLTLFLAAALIASGIMRIWLGVELRPLPASGWIILSGAITSLAGLVFMLGWPVNSVYLLGMLLAFDLTFQGASIIAAALMFRSLK